MVLAVFSPRTIKVADAALARLVDLANAGRARMKSLSPKLLIFLTVLVDLIGFGIIIPLLPSYGVKFGASGIQLGMLLAIHSAMQFIVSPMLGRLSDRVGRRPVLVISILGNVVAYSLLATAGSLWMLFLARFISGISAANITAAQAYLADVTPREKRAGAMGLIGAAFGIGFVLGPALAGVMSHIDMAAPFWAATGLALVNLAWVALGLPESLTPERRAEQMAQRAVGGAAWPAESRFPLLLVAYFLAVCGFSVMTTPLFPLYLTNRFGFDVSHVGYTFAMIGVIGALVQGGVVRRIEPRVGSKKLASVGSILLIGSLLMLAVAQTLPAMLVWISGVALGNGLMQPALNTIASRFAYDHHQGRAMGFISSAGSLGRVLGPLISGALIVVSRPGAPVIDKSFGTTALFVAAGITGLSFLLLLAVPSDRSIRH